MATCINVLDQMAKDLNIRIELLAYLDPREPVKRVRPIVVKIPES